MTHWLSNTSSTGTLDGADIANGTYKLYIDLGEGSCGDDA